MADTSKEINQMYTDITALFQKLRAYESALHTITFVCAKSEAYTDAAKAYHIANKALKGE